MSKKRNSKPSARSFPSTLPSTHMCCKMCWHGSTRPTRRSFRRVQRGEKAGFPRFKGRSRFHSFTFKEYGNGARLDNGFLVRATIGRISVHWSRPLEGTPKTVAISKEADGWYVAISCAEAPIHPLPSTGQETAIDLGLESFATLATGQPIFTPSYYRKAEGHLRRCQRRVARRKKGSHRRRKAVALLAKAQPHIARQRRDFDHQHAHTLVEVYDVIDHEDLQTANMVRNHHLATSISDAGWGQFLTMLAFKAASAGKRVVAVNPAFTSQRCSGPGCGAIVSKGLSVRWHRRPECGASLHRDHNAALNILRLGQAMPSAGRPPSDATVSRWAVRSPRTRGASAPAECQDVRAILIEIRRMVRDALPDTTEIFYHGALGYIPTPSGFEMILCVTPQNGYVDLGFFFGVSVTDPLGLLEGTGKRMRHVKLRSVHAAQNPALIPMMQQAWDNGVKAYADLHKARRKRREVPTER
jgi:putative transposase